MARARGLLATTLAVAGLLAACGDNMRVPTVPGTPDAAPCIPSTGIPKLDLLFVTETSAGSEALALFVRAIDFHVLADENGELPDLHIGVITADLGTAGYPVSACSVSGDGGRLQGQPRQTDCGLLPEPFIRYELNEDGSRVQNFTEGSLEKALACRVWAGGGCGFDQPLEALRLALSGEVPENAGFLRDEAALGIVFWSEQDDCSAADPAIFDRDAGAYGPWGAIRCTEYGVLCGVPPRPIRGEPGTYYACIPRYDVEVLYHPQRVVDFLHELKPDPTDLAFGLWANEPTPLVVGADDQGRVQVEIVCDGVTYTAVSPSVRLHYLIEQFPYRATQRQCQTPSPEAVAELFRPMRKALYCE